MQQIYLPILVSSHNKLLLSLATAEVNIKKNYLLLTMEIVFYTTGDIFLSRGIVKEKLLKWNEAIDDYKKANQIFRSKPFGNDDPTVFSNIANAETGLLQWENVWTQYS